MRLLVITCALLIPVPSEAEEPADPCSSLPNRENVSLEILGKCASRKLGVDLGLKEKTPVQRERTELKLAIEIIEATEKCDGTLVTPTGGIRGADYDKVLDLYRTSQVLPDCAARTAGELSVGRKLVDSEDSTGNRFTEKVPLLVSYKDDREGKESGLTVLGRVEYQWGDSLEVKQSLFADVDSSTKDERSNSSVNLGYAYSLLIVYDEDAFITDLERTAGAEWNTDRGFQRKAYTAYYTLTPSSKALGAGYLRGTRWKISWQPHLSFQAGHVIDAAGNEALEQREQDGGFARVAPSVSLVAKPEALPKLAMGLSYLHTWDVTHGWDKGLLEANITYTFAKGTFWTLIYRNGSKKVSFDRIDETLFGIGITY